MHTTKKKILIAQVGARGLQKTKYSSTMTENDQRMDFIETKYSFEAFMREMKRKNCFIDYLILIGTEKSKYALIYDCEEDVDIAGNRENVEDNISRALISRLGLPELKVKIAVTNYGLDTREQDENFEIIKKAMEEVLNADKNASELEVYFDISNGFRSIPIYIYTMMNYLVRIRKEKFRLHMCYGMYEAKDDFNGITPLVDLAHVNELMEWINAANEFHNYGSVKELVKIFDKEENCWQEKLNLKTMFQRFDYASNANNLGVLKETIAQISNLKEQKMDKEEIPNYAKELLHAIGEEFTKEFSQNDRNPALCSYGEEKQYSYAYLTLHLANWYMMQGRIGNASVALQEGVCTFVMERWPEEADLLIQKKEKNTGYDRNKIEWMTRFSNRKVLNEMFHLADFNELSILEAGTSEELKALSICEKMNIIRTVIRNPEAHILLKNDITEEHIYKSRTVLQSFISFMISMVGKKAENEEELHQILLDKLSNISEEDTEKDRNRRWTAYLESVKAGEYGLVQEFDEKDIPWKPCFDTFVKELRIMKDCRIYSALNEQEMIRRFRQKEKTMKYIPKLLYEQYHHPEKLDYKKILRRGGNKNNFGDEKILNWTITNIKVLYQLFYEEG